MPVIKLLDDTSVTASPNQSILDAVLGGGRVLEYSCRNGRCGVCKAEIYDGDTEILQPEESLTTSDRRNGMILTCCRAALTDVTLAVEPLDFLQGMDAKTLPCRIDSLTALGPSTVEVTLRLPPGSEMEFVAGMYANVIAPMGEVRSYSFANNPRRDNKLVFFIENVPGGVLSDYWFNDAKVDDLLRLDGPYGTFCLRPDAKVSDLCLLATGTGIAPIKAILESLDADPDGHRFSSIKLFWGCRHQKDLFWTPKFENINVEFFPVLSRERLTLHHKRYVQDELLDNVAHLTDTAVYACGSPSMVASAAEVLIASGLRHDRFFSDAFVSTSGAQE